MKKYQQGDVLFISEDKSKVMINSDGKRLIKMDEWSKEHNKLELPPGLYRTRIVREFDHLSQRTRNVVD